MVNLDPVVVIKSSSGLISPIRVQYTMGGLVGAGHGDYVDQVRGPYSDLSEIETDFPEIVSTSGKTAIYRAARLYFDNGGRELYICEYDLGSENTDNTQTGDGTTKKFTPVGITLQMEAGTVKVKVGAVTLEEGLDYLVDYSNGDIYFDSAPANLATLEFKWKETTTTYIEAALDELETCDINIVTAAYQFNATLVEKVYDHVVAAVANGNSRIAFLNGTWLDATNILTLATAVDTELVSICSNRCGYADENADTPSDTWLEFRDYASAKMGVACSELPWESLFYKDIGGINWHGQWNSTDLAALSAAFIDFAYDPKWLLGTGVVIKESWVVDSSREFEYIDEIRTYQYVEALLKSYLSVPAIIGHVKLSKFSDVARVYNLVTLIQSQLFAAGAIADPATLYDRFEVDPIVFPLYNALLAQQNGEATALQLQTITDAESSREATIYFAYRQAKSLHKITIYLTPL